MVTVVVRVNRLELGRAGAEVQGGKCATFL